MEKFRYFDNYYYLLDNEEKLKPFFNVREHFKHVEMLEMLEKFLEDIFANRSKYNRLGRSFPVLYNIADNLDELINKERNKLVTYEDVKNIVKCLSDNDSEALEKLREKYLNYWKGVKQ